MRAFILLTFVFLCIKACQAQRKASDKYIIPILWHGPNNQITEIKEAISLAHLVPGSVAVVPNLQEHKFSDGGVNNMLSDELFSFEALRREKAAVLIGDLRKEGWNGNLDMILYFRDEEFPQVRGMVRDMGLKPPAEDKWTRSPISVTRGCSAAQIQELRNLLQPHRYVGMLCYDDFALQTHKLAGTLLSNCSGNQCCQAYKERSVLLKKSETIYALAQDFIRKSIGSTPFIAGHIRPMPDDCVTLWRSPKPVLSTAEMSNICRTDYMYSRFVPNLQALQRLYNTSTVFIMTHPLIRPRVFRMLKEGGIRPVFIDMAQLNDSIAASKQPLRTSLSFSLLAMVEEAVAAAATAFLGTGESSMTGMIVQERIANGLPPNSSYFISPHPNNTILPCALPDFYTRRDARLRRRAEAGIGAPLTVRLPPH